MQHYERRLPHWDVIGHPLFVTFRLHGSRPNSRVFPPGPLDSAGKAFVAMPLLLRRPEIAQVVVAALQHGDTALHRYQLHSFVVMPNHVHLLVTPHVVSRQWVGPLKGLTAHQGNLLLGKHGALWQDKSYDHLVRSGEFERIRGYIELNPVKAGLVAAPEEFLWSSAHQS